MLTDFKEIFSESYQATFNKILVGKVVANTRFEAGLRSGDTVHRFKYDISGVLVRDITNLSDRTIDSVTDSDETLVVDQKKGTTFPISAHEKTQAGALSPAITIGRDVAFKLATYIDADILGETKNANQNFDNGDLTTLASTGTPITLSSTTVPQMVSRMPAKLRKANQTLTNMCFVIDSYGASDVTQYLMGKSIDNSLAVFKNGYSGPISSGADMYVSENLTGEATLGMATQPTADDTVVIEGVTFTFVASPSSAGDVDLGSDADESRLHLSYAINGTGTAGTDYTEISAADRATLTAARIVAVNDDDADTLTITGKGAGRLTVAETFTDGTDAWANNLIYAYFGKKGAIDVVIQDKVDMEMREEPKQRTTNILADALYGYKTFDDASKTFLAVKIAA